MAETVLDVIRVRGNTEFNDFYSDVYGSNYASPGGINFGWEMFMMNIEHTYLGLAYAYLEDIGHTIQNIFGEELKSRFLDFFSVNTFEEHINILTYISIADYALKYGDVTESELLNGLFNPEFSIESTAAEAAVNSTQKEFTGTAFTPFSAFHHWFTGNGETARVSIQSLGLNITPNEIKIEKENVFLPLTTNGKIGQTEILINQFSYNTYDDNNTTGSYLGSISLKIEGTLHQYEDGSWSFDGEARAYYDEFNFNKADRTPIVEALVAFVDLMPGTDYEIDIYGSLPIHWNSGMDFL